MGSWFLISSKKKNHRSSGTSDGRGGGDGGWDSWNFVINSHALSDDLEKGDGSIILVCHGNRSGVSNSIYHDSTIVCSLERLVQFRLKQCVELKQRIFF